MSRSSRKKKRSPPRRGDPAANASPKSLPLGRNGVYLLIAICFVVGVGGGTWIRHRLSRSAAPQAAERESAVLETPDTSRNSRSVTPPLDTAPNPTDSAAATTDAAPFQPPRDPATAHGLSRNLDAFSVAVTEISTPNATQPPHRISWKRSKSRPTKSRGNTTWVRFMPR